MSKEKTAKNRHRRVSCTRRGRSAVLFFYTRGANSKPATREDRISALSWVAWFCGQEFDPDKCVLTKEVEMPEATEIDLWAETSFTRYLEQEQQQRSDALSRGVRQMHER
jgi:hypothetical protein